MKKVVQSDDPDNWKQRALASEAKVVELELQCSKAQTLLQEKIKLIERMAYVTVGELENIKNE